jgi:hypothetical protein
MNKIKLKKTGVIDSCPVVPLLKLFYEKPKSTKLEKRKAKELSSISTKYNPLDV